MLTYSFLKSISLCLFLLVHLLSNIGCHEILSIAFFLGYLTLKGYELSARTTLEKGENKIEMEIEEQANMIYKWRCEHWIQDVKSLANLSQRWIFIKE